MLTSINFFISNEFEDLKLRELVAKLCDVIVDEGYGNIMDGGVTSVGVVKLYEIDDIEQPGFLEDMFQDSVIAVLPITNEGEENVG